MLAGPAVGVCVFMFVCKPVRGIYAETCLLHVSDDTSGSDMISDERTHIHTPALRQISQITQAIDNPPPRI